MSQGQATHEVRFLSLHDAGRALVFPCDPQGAVDIDAMPERARVNYFAARALIGREFAYPVVHSTADRAPQGAQLTTPSC